VVPRATEATGFRPIRRCGRPEGGPHVNKGLVGNAACQLCPLNFAKPLRHSASESEVPSMTIRSRKADPRTCRAYGPPQDSTRAGSSLPRATEYSPKSSAQTGNRPLSASGSSDPTHRLPAIRFGRTRPRCPLRATHRRCASSFRILRGVAQEHRLA